MHHRKRHLAWIAIGLGALALLFVVSGRFFAPWRYGYNYQFDRPPAAAPYDAPGSREDVGPRGEAGPRGGFNSRGGNFEQERYEHDRYTPWWYHSYGKFHHHRGFGLGPILLGGLLIALGIWLFRRGNRDDGSQDPPPTSEQTTVV